MSQNILKSKVMAEGIAKSHPMKRIGKTKEVADSILWLLSEKSSFVNGHSISIDGGYGSL